LEEFIIKEIILALITGLIVGFIFKLVKLPIPAPSALAGVVGIVGIYYGAKLAELAIGIFFKQ